MRTLLSLLALQDLGEASAKQSAEQGRYFGLYKLLEAGVTRLRAMWQICLQKVPDLRLSPLCAGATGICLHSADTGRRKRCRDL